MTGKELMNWITENHAEEKTVIVVTDKFDYLRIEGVWEGETDGGAIMLEAKEQPTP